VSSKLKFLITRQPGIADSEIAEALRFEAERVREGLRHNISFAIGVPLSQELLKDKPVAESFSLTFDSVLDVTVENASDLEPSIERMKGFAQRLSRFILAPKCCVAAGETHTIIEGAGDVHLVFGGRRLSHLTHDQYTEYWLNKHGPLARDLNPLKSGQGYRQFHPNVAAIARAAEITGVPSSTFDGLAECYFTDLDAMLALMNRQDIHEIVTADERHFVDHARSEMTLVQLTPF
jgi:hypothetical protein